MLELHACAAVVLALVAAPVLAGTDSPLPSPPVDSSTQEAQASPPPIDDKSHPDYIKCRSEPVIGSRAKKRKVCLTNRQWAEVAAQGNDVARRTVEEGRAGMAFN